MVLSVGEGKRIFGRSWSLLEVACLVQAARAGWSDDLASYLS